MAGDQPKPDPRVIVAYLDDVELELDAAKRLIADPSNDEVLVWLKTIAGLSVEARTEFSPGVST